MPGHRLFRGAVLATASSVLATGLVAAPAQAAWTHAGEIVHYKICRKATPSGKGWQFVSRVRKSDDGTEARAGVRLRHHGKARARWRSGWLDDDEVEVGVARIRRSKGVRVQIWQEAGDPDSPIGTAATVTAYRPRQIRHC